jgi:hypothetical protein
MNIRIFWDSINQKIEIAGRTDNAQIPGDLLKELNIILTISKFLEIYPDISMTLYGEGYGAGIQKNGGNYSYKKTFILFDVFIDNFWLSRENVEDIANKLGIKFVPTIGSGILEEMILLVKTGIPSQFGNFIAEGIVARPEFELFTREGKRIITKAKYRDF